MMLLSRQSALPINRILQRSGSNSLLSRSTSANVYSKISRRQFSIGGTASSSSSQHAPLFKYNVAVSYSAKQRDLDFDTLKNPAGEDSYVLYEKNSNLVLGVADGVGGWSEVKNCSSADMSRELCKSIAIYFNQTIEKYTKEATKNTTLDAKEILNQAYEDIQIDERVKVGGTTICYGMLQANSDILKVLNLGDSWCGQFRDYKCINQTKFQTHGFNTPYQLSIIPKEMQQAAERQGRRYVLDMPKHADVYDFKLQKNDIVIFATDGLTDNVIPEDIEIFLKDEFSGIDTNGKKLQEQKSLKFIADKLVLETKKLSANPHYSSPFSQELSALTGQNYSGGKQDDITIVVLKVE